MSSPEEFASQNSLHYRLGEIHQDVVTLPPVIDLYCDACRKEQLWDTPVTYGGGSGIHHRKASSSYGTVEYTCRNCRGKKVLHHFAWFSLKESDTSVFFKIGQYPPLRQEQPAGLRKAFDDEDIDFYRKALPAETSPSASAR